MVDLNVHWGRAADGEAQPHAHVMLTMRAVGLDGFGQKVRTWNRTERLVGWRERWADSANERLVELGMTSGSTISRIAVQGIERSHRQDRPAGMRREMRGEDAERAAEHEALARRTASGSSPIQRACWKS